MGLADFCVARSDRIWPYPEAVLELPGDCPITVKSSMPARVAVYGHSSPTERYYMLAAGYGAASEGRSVPARRALAFAALGFGLTPLVRIGSWGLRRVRRWLR
jgi:hypothetical protein